MLKQTIYTVFVLLFSSAICAIKLKVTNNLAKRFSVEHLMNKTSNTNSLTSSASLICPLTKLALGATGLTRLEILSALGIDKGKHMANQCLLMKQVLTGLSRVDLMVVNEIYIDDSYQVDLNFTLNSSLLYDTDVQKISFKKYPKTSVSFINRRVAERTLRRVQNILQPSDINNETSIVVINAAHFKGTWEHPFDEKYTRYDSFISLGNRVTKVPMMNRRDEYPYFESDELDSKIVDLKFVYYGSCMTIVLPNSANGLQTLLTKMAKDPTALVRARKKLHFERIFLNLPRFKIKSNDTEISDFLKKIGIKKIFEKEGEFTEIGRKVTQNLRVSLIKQKLYLEINEYGSEKKYTPHSFIVAEESQDRVNPLGRNEVDVTINRPFYFSIYVGLNIQLFEGVYYGPEI